MPDMENTAKYLLLIHILSYNVDCTINFNNSINNTITL